MRIASRFRHVSQFVNALRRQTGHPPEDRALGDVIPGPVFVINLERSRLRRDYMQGYLHGLGIEPIFVPAVDGSRLDHSELARQGLYDEALARQKFSRTLSPGEIGCTLSHVGIYQRMRDEQIPVAMVLEDDIMFVDGVADRLRNALAELPQNWDFLQLYYWCKETTPYSPNLVTFPAKTCMPVGSLGYIIRHSGAIKMLNAALPVCYPADSLMGRSPRWGVALYGSSVPLINLNINDVFPSDVHTPRRLAARLRNRVKHVIVGAAGRVFARQ